jgi:hypothetical protein
MRLKNERRIKMEFSSRKINSRKLRITWERNGGGNVYHTLILSIVNEGLYSIVDPESDIDMPTLETRVLNPNVLAPDLADRIFNSNYNIHGEMSAAQLARIAEKIEAEFKEMEAEESEDTGN